METISPTPQPKPRRRLTIESPSADGSECKIEMSPNPSQQSKTGINEMICRICMESTIPGLMVSPCDCSADQTHVHYKCLKNLVEDSGLNHCLVCGQSWIGFTVMGTKKTIKDFMAEENSMAKIMFCNFIQMVIINYLVVYIGIITFVINELDAISWLSFFAGLTVILIYYFIVRIFFEYYTFWKRGNYKYIINDLEQL